MASDLGGGRDRQPERNRAGQANPELVWELPVFLDPLFHVPRGELKDRLSLMVDKNRRVLYHSNSPVPLWKTYSLPLTVITPSFMVHFLESQNKLWSAIDSLKDGHQKGRKEYLFHETYHLFLTRCTLSYMQSII